MKTSSWKTGILLRKAYNRTKDRLKTVLIVNLLGMLMILASIGAFGYLIFIASSWVNHHEIILLVLAFFVGIVLLLVFFYILFWIQLAITYALISPQKKHSKEVYVQTKPLVNGYIRYASATTLFNLFLIPADLLISTVLLVRPISLLWGFWGSFGSFVYLEQQKKGLENLWVSRKMINQNFWKVAGKMFIAGFIPLIAIMASIIALIAIFAVEKGDITSPGVLAPVIIFGIVFVLTVLLAGPFMLSFTYEVYKNLTIPKEVHKPREWIWIGIIGIVLSIASLFFVPQKFNQSWQQFMKEPPVQRNR